MGIAPAIKAGCGEQMPAWKSADKTIPDIELSAIARRTEQPVAMRFAEMVNAHGERPAVIAPGRTWSYRELASVVEMMRRQLEEANVVRGTGVGILLTEPAQQIAAMLGVLAAGGFYVVLDAEFPIERLKAIGNDGAFSLLLTEPSLADYTRDAVAEAVPRLWWRNMEPTPASENRPAATVEPGDLAYVTYTSGSTGRPKGVMHTQANIQHEAAVHAWALDLGPSDRASLLYSPSVLGSVRDIFGMLLNGGAVCPFPFKREGWGALAQWLQEQRITRLHAVPAIFRELMRAMPPGAQLANVRTVFLSGDRVTPQDVKLFRVHFPTGATFYTGLGASEANSIYTHWTVDPATVAEGEQLPSGWPLPDKEIIIRDDEGQPVERGAAGTITVVSRYLACGYWNRPELTAEVFAPAGDGSRRQYHTGDRGYFDHAGRLVHLGRGDQQIKINGERIELGEIEQALLQEGNVRQAVVRVFTAATDGAPRLAAFVVPAPNGFDERAVRRNLAQRLPPAARTLRIVCLEALPMTGNGKIDRQALADPGETREDTDDASRADWSETEQQLLRIWRDVLPEAGIIGRDTRLDDLGGDSLRAMRLAMLLEQTFGLTWPKTLHKGDATIAALAEAIRLQRAGARTGRFSRLHTLAALWQMETISQPVAHLPVFLVNPTATGVPMIWVGQPGKGIEVGMALARTRPVYMVPALSQAPELGLAEIKQEYTQLTRALSPYLPSRLMVGGCCHSGLCAVDMAAEAALLGKRIEGYCLLDAAVSNTAMSWFYETLRISNWRDRIRRGEVRLNRAEIARMARRFTKRITRTKARRGADASGAAMDAVRHEAPADYAGWVLLGYSSTMAWPRWIWPQLGWEKFHRASVRERRLSGPHRELWSKNNIEIIAGQVAELALTEFTQSATPHD